MKDFNFIEWLLPIRDILRQILDTAPFRTLKKILPETINLEWVLMGGLVILVVAVFLFFGAL